MDTNDLVTASDAIKLFEDGFLGRWMEDLVPKVAAVVGCLVLAIIVFLIGKKLVKVIVKLMQKSMERHNVDQSLATFLESLVKWLCYILLATMILGLFGITTSTIAAAVAAMGITAGLSLQGALSNFVGGCLILLMHPFRVGDYIKEDAHQNEGVVSAVSILYTTLTSIDGKQIVVPNGSLANTSLTNYSSKGKRMINETVGISYDADIKKAKEILTQIAKDEGRLLKDDAINVFVSSLEDSAVSLGIRFWVNVDDYWTVKWDTLEEIKSRFEKNNIEICYNQVDVHVISQQ